MTMSGSLRTLTIGLILAVAAVVPAVAQQPVDTPAGETLIQVRERGTLRCGVNPGLPGFAEQGEGWPLARLRRGLLPRDCRCHLR